MAKKVRLTPGEVYRNRNGKDYKCVTPTYLDYPLGEERMQNVKTGWTMRAHGVQVYADGTIEWDYSTGGYFDERGKGKWPVSDNTRKSTQ